MWSYTRPIGGHWNLVLIFLIFLFLEENILKYDVCFLSRKREVVIVWHLVEIGISQNWPLAGGYRAWATPMPSLSWHPQLAICKG